MESEIVRHLDPEFDPVAVVWSDVIPDDALLFTEGKFGCILFLLAEASRRGRVAGGSRRTIVCLGGRAAMGFGVGLDASPELMDRYSAVFSKGMASTSDQAAYEARMEASPKRWRSLYEYGERRHASPDLARSWIRFELPRYDVGKEFVLFKPLHLLDDRDDLRAVIFPVNPLELAGLVTLAGSVLSGSDPVRAPQGPACTTLTAFAYAEGDSPSPRAVLGMLGPDGREVMRKRFRDDTLTLTLPEPLFQLMEAEAKDSILRTPSWRALRRGGGDGLPG